MNLKPLGDRLVIKQVVAEETTKSGIVLPGQTKEKPQEATVVAVGKDVKEELNVGDTIVYSKYAGTNVKVDDEEYIIVKEEDVLAVLQA
ncbi:MAG: co-chaperone GroES [Lachnospiraceae bacterium]|nr:co-chaperone GroES [Lachnospiraceae bacterium]